MKKIVKLFVFIFLTFLLMPYVYAESKVKIISVSEDSVKGTTEILEKPLFKDLNVSFNIRFKNVNDSIKYKIVLKNNGDKDYKISDDVESFQPSKYIKYEYEFDNNEKIIGKGKEKVLYITLTYNKDLTKPEIIKEETEAQKKSKAMAEASDAAEEAAAELEKIYSEKNRLVINLDEREENPNTESHFKIPAIIGLFIISSGALIILYKRKKSPIVFLLLGLLVIPFTIYALERNTFIADTVIEIVPEREITFQIKDLNSSPAYSITYTSINGSSWLEWINSIYNRGTNRLEYDDLKYIYYSYESPTKNQKVTPTDKIERNHTYFFYSDFPELEKEVEERR